MVPMIYTLYGFAIFFFIYWSAMWILHILAIFYGKYKLHRKLPQLSLEEPCPGVSILKPLMGVDSNLAANLETYFTMSYPQYELLFCVEEEIDPAVAVVEELIKKYPKVSAKLYRGAVTVGVNPKINNMHRAFEDSIYELVLVSDSGIKMKEDTLLDMVYCMTEKTGLVHQMPFTCDRTGFAAALEKIYFGTAQSRIYLVADLLRINCHTGMSTLLRKSVLKESGGLKSFGCYLAEDFFICKYYLDKGWRTTVSSQPALQNSGVCDVNNFQARLTRWAKLRVAMVPLVLIFEPLSECMVIGACTAWASSVLFQWDSLAFYLIHILFWFICDWILLTTVQNGSLPFNKFDFLVAWLFRECSGPYLFLHAVIYPNIQWRNRVFRLAWGGVAQEVKPRIKC